MEGDFRHSHDRLIRHSEEVAFFAGGHRERSNLNVSFDRLYRHSSTLFRKQGIMAILENYFIKYGASLVGYGVCAIPVFAPRDGIAGDASSRTEQYVVNTQLLINLARGIGQLVMLYRRIMTLSGLTARVSELLEMMDER